MSAAEFIPFDVGSFARANSSALAAAIATADDWSIDAEPAENCQSVSILHSAVATIAEIAGGNDFSWSGALNLFADRPHPSGVSPDFWGELTQEAWTVSRDWGALAIDAGWDPLWLFGCNPDPTRGRVDRDGLVMVTVGMKTPLRIVALTPSYAELHDPHGSVLRYRPPTAPGAVFLWDAYPMTGGP